MKKLRLILALVVVTFVPMSVMAQVILPLTQVIAPPDPEAGVAGFAAAVYQAFSNKNWGVLVALVLVGLVFLARRFGSKAWPFLSTDRGGALLSLVGGLGTAVFTAATAAGSHTVLQVLGAGLLMTITASGTYVLLKKLLFPSGAEQAQEIKAAEPAAEAAAARAAEAASGNAAEKLAGVLR